ncbi:MAG TPA: tetratricopeptide repeat protein [Terriglobales bacterium]|nr:tetratricopeptide repeat protein [Terriglobales bacterium]
MKQRFAIFVILVSMAALCATPLFAQATGSVKGVCKDVEGNPIVGATVQWQSAETGRKYDLKTNKKGEYFSLGIQPGKYNVSLNKEGKELFHFNGVQVTLDETNLDFDLKKEQTNAAKGQGLSPEQLKQMQEQQAKAQKEQLTVKALNEKLAASNQAQAAGNYDEAINILNEATQMDATRDLLWFKLGDAYRMAATKQTDPAEKTKRFQQAVEAYNKAIAIKPAGAYYNNLAEAEAKSGKIDDAIKAYAQATQADPANAAQYAFNEGAVLTNAGKVDEAIQAFDKVIAADPNKADAYYWKGVNLIWKATLKGDKMVAPEGTAEAFNKYLELAPTGPFAEPAKQMLSSIGATIETQFGKKKTTKK